MSVLTGLCRLGDLLLLLLTSAATGCLLRIGAPVPRIGEAVVVSLIAIAAYRVTAEQCHTYTLAALMDPLGWLSRLSITMGAGAVAAVTTLWLLHYPDEPVPYLVTQPLAWFLAGGAAILAFRSVVAWRLQDHARAGRLSTRVALIGANAASLRFIRDAADEPRLSVIGIYDDRATRLPAGVARTWIRGDVDSLVELARQQPVDAVVIALPLSATARITEIRQRLAGIATDVFLTTDAFTHSGAQFTTLGVSPVLSVSSRPLKDWPAFKKTLFDRVASALFLLAALPAMALIAIIVKLDSPGPALFRQAREGLNGRPFLMFKFRTMVVQSSIDESVQATARDKRVTRSGYWLRRFSLDELPQLWNVLRGDMSLVGPRPHLATTRAAGNRLLREIFPHYQARHRMKPGLTGWAQVQGLRGETRTEQEVSDRVAQDLYYIDNWSLGLDLKIILRTLLSEIVSRSGKAH
jgi:Undecaprenyl-phosphate glucose phosphotransferase